MTCGFNKLSCCGLIPILFTLIFIIIIQHRLDQITGVGDINS